MLRRVKGVSDADSPRHNSHSICVVPRVDDADLAFEGWVVVGARNMTQIVKGIAGLLRPRQGDSGVKLSIVASGMGFPRPSATPNAR